MVTTAARGPGAPVPNLVLRGNISSVFQIVNTNSLQISLPANVKGKVHCHKETGISINLTLLTRLQPHVYLGEVFSKVALFSRVHNLSSWHCHLPGL